MRKKAIKNLLDETDLKLKQTVMENRQLRVRLEQYEQLDKSMEEQNNENAVLIESLREENAKLKEELDTYKQQHDTQVSELENEINELNSELNSLKGTYYDTCKYAEDLKEKLEEACNMDDQEKPRDFTEIPLPPPTVEKIVSIEEKDSDAFEYASEIISKTVIEAAKLKNSLSNYSDPMVSELITLSMGKTEMLKADILQTVMSDMILDAKKQYIDRIFNETIDYFDGLLGQVSATNE